MMISAGMLFRFVSLPVALAAFILAAQASGGFVLRTTAPAPVVVSMR
ncbi:MAG: hypothetical protein ABW151_14415 [Pseudorhodoplanes sp.]